MSPLLYLGSNPRSTLHTSTATTGPSRRPPCPFNTAGEPPGRRLLHSDDERRVGGRGIQRRETHPFPPKEGTNVEKTG
jgi:hypothetical protein